MNRVSLKNMTEEEKKAHKRKLHRLHQRKYYEKNKDYYRNYQRNWARELKQNYSKIYRVLSSIIEELNATGEAEQVIAKIEYCLKIMKEGKE